MIAYKTVHRQQFKMSPNTGLGAGAALTMLLLGAVAVSVSKRTKDK